MVGENTGRIGALLVIPTTEDRSAPNRSVLFLRRRGRLVGPVVNQIVDLRRKALGLAQAIGRLRHGSKTAIDEACAQTNR